MKKPLSFVLLTLLVSGCVSAQKDYRKPNVDQNQFFSDKYECAWKYHETKVLDSNVNMPSNTGYAGAAAGGFLEGYSKQSSRFDIYKDCLSERGYTRQEVTKEEYDASMKAFADYSKERNAKEGRAQSE